MKTKQWTAKLATSTKTWVIDDKDSDDDNEHQAHMMVIDDEDADNDHTGAAKSHQAHMMQQDISTPRFQYGQYNGRSFEEVTDK